MTNNNINKARIVCTTKANCQMCFGPVINATPLS